MTPLEVLKQAHDRRNRCEAAKRQAQQAVAAFETNNEFRGKFYLHQALFALVPSKPKVEELKVTL